MILVGTSGWQYKDWRGRFYPTDVPQRRWLEHYATQFATVEINNAFYRLPERDTFAQWRARTVLDTTADDATADDATADDATADDATATDGTTNDDSFCFAVKMSRYLTHIKRLRDPAEPVSRFLGRAEALGDRLGPVLLQLPPNLMADADLLDDTLKRFPANVRVAVEPRHRSWWTTDIRQVLERRHAALSWADRRGRPVTPLWRTAEWGYLRMHEGTARPRPSYGRAALASWLDRATDAFAPMTDHDVSVYFNNDHGGAAVRDAAAFGRLAARRGLSVSRYPQAAAVLADPVDPPEQVDSPDQMNSARTRSAGA
jgi:uncharacterized protein YecE (DUF72 family)